MLSSQTDKKVVFRHLISNVIKKAITAALRYGGDYLGKLLSKLSPSAGNFVNKYSSELPIPSILFRIGKRKLEVSENILYFLQK